MKFVSFKYLLLAALRMWSMGVWEDQWLYRPLSEHLVSMVLSYWWSSVELDDLFSTFMRVA